MAPELFRLLEAIADGGSIRVAAEAIGISYRHAWGLLREWSERLGAPLARLERGRGSTLLPLGEALLAAERRLAAQVGPQLARLALELAPTLAPPEHALEKRLRIAASHSLAIAALREILGAKPASIDLDFATHGSTESLKRLAGARCDLAGFHCPEGALGARVAPELRRYLRADTHALILVARREQGLIVAAGNPRQVSSVRDLARPRLRFINRQPGSGTRLLFDEILATEGISPRSIPGYRNEEFTHLAVAAMVASGAADVGMGIRAAASQFGLGFVPLAFEGYYLALRAELLDDRAVQLVRATLHSESFRDAMRRHAGYDVSRAGELGRLEDLPN